MTYTFNYKSAYEEVVSPEVTMTFDEEVTIDTFLEFIQNFMQASGYVFNDGDYLTVGNRNDEDEDYNNTVTCEKHWNDFWEDDGFSMTGNPNASPDTVQFTSSGVLGGMGDDVIFFPSSTSTTVF
jgi:hypothetical protein